jgi:UDP-2,3-diacylglucosamine pyrophosphatase LpxH
LAVATLLGVWREHMSDTAHWVKKEHERKMALLAEARQISLVKLQALASLQRPPITKSVLRLLAGCMIDRVAVAVAATVAAVWLLVARWTPALGVAATLSLAGLAAVAWLWRRARGNIDASASLRERAARVGSVFPAAFVVMGHTHLPEIRATSPESSYVNLGAWAEEELGEGETTSLPATRTHLVVQLVDDRPTAALLSWDAEVGPKRF